MARYAIVKGTNVENLTEWDGDTNSWSPPTGTTAVALGDNPCGVGWTYADNKFSSILFEILSSEFDMSGS